MSVLCIYPSKGCGAIMRVAPVALYGGVHCDTLADDCSHLTHAHPTGRNAARAQAYILAQLLDGIPLEDAVRSLHTLYLDSDTRAAVERAWTTVPDGRSERVETLGQGWVAEEALRIAVTHSGDSDSTAAIAGNLLGLMFPDEVLAHPWRKQIECADLINRLAGDLCDARHHNTGERFALTMWEFYPGG